MLPLNTQLGEKKRRRWSIARLKTARTWTWTRLMRDWTAVATNKEEVILRLRYLCTLIWVTKNMKMMNMTEISITMTTYLITTSVSKTEVSQGWAQVRENPPHSMGDRAEWYKNVANKSPKTMETKTMISTKVTDRHWDASKVPWQDWSSFGSRQNAPQISMPKNYILVMHWSHRHHCIILWGWGTVKSKMDRPRWWRRTSIAEASNSPTNVMAETPDS